MGNNPGDFGQIDGGQTSGFAGPFGDLFSDNPLFAIFFGVIALIIAVVFVIVIVQLIRGKGRGRYVVMYQDDSGRPAGETAAMRDARTARTMADTANQQMMNQQIINQQMFPPQPPTGL